MVRQLFSDCEFRAYFQARQSTVLASAIEDVAIAWQIFSLRHQPFDLGLVGLMFFLPQLLLALPAGIIADRCDRRSICFSCTLVEVAFLGGFVMLIHSGVRSLGVYLAAIACIGSIQAIGSPARRSLLAGIVRSTHFVRASALSSSMSRLISIAGPAIAGLLIAIGTPIAFGASALCYVVAATGYWSLRPRPIAADDELPLLRSALEGIRFIFDHKVILGAISLDLFAVLFGGATSLLPVYATKILHVGPTGFGLLRAAPAAGALLVALTLARRPIERRVGPTMYWCVAAFGIGTIVFGISRNIWLSIVALAVTGGFDMVSVVIRTALVQLGTHDAMRGRVGAVENVFIGASNDLGAFESGSVAGLLGTEASVVIGGIATLIVIAIWALLFPALRRFDRFDQPAGGAT